MSSEEFKTKGLNIIFSDGSYRNQMMHNRTDACVGYVKMSEEFHEFCKTANHKEITSTINKSLTGKAYIEFHTVYPWRRFSDCVWFANEVDLMAFKLMWS